MLSFNTYHRPDSLQMAYDLLEQNKRAQLLGGGAFLRMGNRRLTDLIDLSALNLDRVSVGSGVVEIGAMNTFHDLETSGVLPGTHSQYFKSALGQIAGVQLRNMVTVGGTLYSRYGFSDLNTALLALGGSVHLYAGGEKELDAFLEGPHPSRDILTRVTVPSNLEFGAFHSTRRSSADYAIVNLAVARVNGQLRIASGARPHRAVLAKRTMAFLKERELTPAAIRRAVEIFGDEVTFGTNRLASAEYRKAAASGLLKLALEEVLDNEG